MYKKALLAILCLLLPAITYFAMPVAYAPTYTQVDSGKVDGVPISNLQWARENPDCIENLPLGSDYEPHVNAKCNERFKNRRRMQVKYGTTLPYNTNGGWGIPAAIHLVDGGYTSLMTTSFVVPNGPPPAFASHFTGNSINSLYLLDGASVENLKFNYWMGVETLTEPEGLVLQPVVACQDSAPQSDVSSPVQCYIFAIYCCQGGAIVVGPAVNPGDTVVMSVWLDTSQPNVIGDAASPGDSWWYAAFAVNPANLNQISYGKNYIHVHDTYDLFGHGSLITSPILGVLEIQTLAYDIAGNLNCYQLPAQDYSAFTVLALGVSYTGSDLHYINPLLLATSPYLSNEFGPTTPTTCGWGGYVDGSTFYQTWDAQGPY
jgi:hypothetical protein